MPVTLSDKSNGSGSSLTECFIGNKCFTFIHSCNNPEVDIIPQFYKWGIWVSNILKNMIQTYKVGNEWGQDLNTRFTPKLLVLTTISYCPYPGLLALGAWQVALNMQPRDGPEQGLARGRLGPTNTFIQVGMVAFFYLDLLWCHAVWVIFLTPKSLSNSGQQSGLVNWGLSVQET